MIDPSLLRDPTDPVSRRHQRDMVALAAWRVFAVLGVWAATLWLRDGASPWSLASLDAGLAAASWWAVLPGLRRGGSRFGWANNWTGMLMVPFVWFTVRFVYSVWSAIHGA
jgi:hypothetical protein